MKMWKRIVGGMLATVMVIGMTACGKMDGFGNKASTPADVQGAGASSTVGKEYVYSMAEFDFEQLKDNENYSVQKIAASDDKIYAVLRIYDANWNDHFELVTMNLDGSDMKSCIIEVKEESAEDSSTEEEDNSWAQVYNNTSYSNFVFQDDYLYASRISYTEDYSDPNNYVMHNENSVCCWDMEGKLLWETPVEILSSTDSWYYINSMAVLPNGNVLLLVSGDTSGQIEVKENGTVSDLQEVEKLKDYFTNPGYSAMMPDGRLMLTYYSNDWKEMYVICYDMDNGTVNAPYPVPSSMTYNGLSNLAVDKAGDMFYTNTEGVYKYHIGEDQPVQVMSFVNSDMALSYFDAYLPLSDTQFVGFYSIYDDKTYMSSLEGGIFTKINPEDIPDKEIMVLGGCYISGDLKKRVVAFNKSSNTHRIILKDYSQYNTNVDYKAGGVQLNKDIISGNMPDILMVDSYSMSLENYVSKGLLEDVGALMEADAEIAGTEYMENIFEACKINGKLYEVIPAFYVSTYVAKTSLVGNASSWTMADAAKVLDSMPEGASLFGDMTRDSFMNLVMEYCGRNYVDPSTGKCNFDSEEFISVMEIAKTLPEELGDDYYDDNWYVRYESQYRDNRTLLSNCYISDMENLVYTINGSFGEDISFVGMPNSGGSGSIVYVPTTYVISSKSAQKDAAWQFLRYYLTEEYQDTLTWQFPVSKKKFDELAQKATKKPVYTDENGNQVEEEYTYWLNDEELILKPLTQKQVADITAFISGVKTRAYYNEDINKIISEEMGAFYQGQKSAKDVAALIQNRAQLFVNENR